MKIKICGLMREDDVRLLGRLHADVAGFVTEYPARVPWNLKRDEAARLIAAAPRGLKTCVVTGGDREKIVGLISALRPDFVQLHYKETLEDTMHIVRALSPLGTGVIKTMPFSRGERLRQFGTDDIRECARLLSDAGVYAILCDPRAPENAAGRSLPADFSLYEAIKDESRVPVILAGGITSENIGEIAKKYDPFMADIMTGAEMSPGVKDELKLREILKFGARIN
ncbi:MAG: phosphoribosylanthranilate isomerase [Clostridia bacterium]|nr:phosphoribosylanthranilate isomerase [Clostridia bacterium]